MNQFFLSLRMDLSQESSAGAGWYIQATSDTGKLLDPIPIATDAALTLATAFQTALQSTDGELPSVSVIQLVQSASGLITKALEEQLRYAEEQAAKVGLLRRKLALTPPKDNQ